MELFSPRELQKTNQSAGTPPGGESYGCGSARQSARRIFADGIRYQNARAHRAIHSIQRGANYLNLNPSRQSRERKRLLRELLLIRHAKSAWTDPSLTDRDRPLNERGKRDAPFMGSLLRFRGMEPDCMVSSPARRARKTARLIAGEVGYDKDAIVIAEQIYLGGRRAVVELVQALNDEDERVYIIGHNPDLSEAASCLTGESLGELPTCGMVAIEFPVYSWTHVMEGAGRLKFFDYPKKHLSP
ncbi:histidine phosphatase family protein [Methylococcus mesophilus]|nr:histidine phosphatase family protein [Methylococcus mesophilus]